MKFAEMSDLALHEWLLAAHATGRRRGSDVDVALAQDECRQREAGKRSRLVVLGAPPRVARHMNTEPARTRD